MTNKVITEVTPLGEKDCFLMVDRDKDAFTYCTSTMRWSLTSWKIAMVHVA